MACPGEVACIDLLVGVPHGASVDHCGACGTTCSLDGASGATCTDGACEPSCAAGFGDCNDAATNDGCETDFDALSFCSTTCDDGVACEGTEVCNAGACGDPQGLVVFTIPFTEAGQTQRYGAVFSGLPNLENASVILRAYAPGALNGTLRLYLSDEDFSWSSDMRVALASIAQGWSDVTMTAREASGDFDPTGIYQLTIEIEAGGTGPWANPTVIYVDSVRTSNGAVHATYDVSQAGMVESSMLTVDGSSLTWADTLP